MDEGLPVRQLALAAAGLLLIGAAIVVGLRDHKPAPVARAVSSGHPGLHVQHDGAALKLHWNTGSADVRAAKAGAIVISDGGRTSRLELTPRDLRAGVASYWPDSREVGFRLELDGAAAGSVRASAEVPQQRPSPFASTQSPRKRGVPIKRVQVQGPAVYEAEEPKRSGVKRVVGKIPLLGRLVGSRDDSKVPGIRR